MRSSIFFWHEMVRVFLSLRRQPSSLCHWEGVRSRTLPTGNDGDGRRADLPLTASASATMGDQGPNSLRFSSPAEGGEVREESNLVGVGIVFQPVEDGTLYVKRMREDSPAARSSLIQIGDCLCEVNGR